MPATWRISQLESRVSDGYVMRAHWQCSDVDGEHTGAVYNVTGWYSNSLNTPYEQLTEEQVLGWIWEKVDRAAVEAVVTAQIELSKNPPVVVGVPWEQPDPQPEPQPEPQP